MDSRPTECLRVPEAAKYLALAQSTLAKMRLRGDGPRFVKAGPRTVTYRKTDLDAWLEARVRRSTSDTGPQSAKRALSSEVE
jgi:excisionase family DNA binding protein